MYLRACLGGCKVLTCFVEEFNRLLSDAIFEALLADQGLEARERRRRGSRRAFEPPPPLFLPAPQLLDGIVQVDQDVFFCFFWRCHTRLRLRPQRLGRVWFGPSVRRSQPQENDSFPQT